MESGGSGGCGDGNGNGAVQDTVVLSTGEGGRAGELYNQLHKFIHTIL